MLNLIAIPVRWPVLIPFHFGIVPFENETILIVYIIASNVTLYTLVTYSLLSAFSKRKPVVDLPPEPECLSEFRVLD